MGSPSFKLSVVDRNVVMRHIPVMLPAVSNFMKSAAWQTVLLL